MTKEQTIQRIWESHWAAAPSSFGDQIRNRFAIEAFRTLRAFVTDGDRLILEAGSGTGRFCTLLAREQPGSRIVGIDASPSALAMAQRLKGAVGCRNVLFVKANLFKLPFADGYFDVVFNEGVVSHFSMDGAPTCADGVREMVRVARAGGKVVVAVPNWYCFPHTLYKWLLKVLERPYQYGYEKSFTHKELIHLLQEHGLRNIEVAGYYPSYGFFRLGHYSRVMTWISRLVDRIEGRRLARRFGFEIIAKGTKC